MMLRTGLYPVPPGHLAAVVTHFELNEQVVAQVPFPKGVSASQDTLDVRDYRALFRAIGAPWLWTSRLKFDDKTLRAVLTNDKVETWVVRRNAEAIGLVELDFRVDASCELAFFGLVPEEIGAGLGKPMMALAQSRAFTKDVNCLHLHTCTLDSPKAIAFYQASGFRAVRREVETFEDPRLSGHLESATAPNHPLILSTSEGA